MNIHVVQQSETIYSIAEYYGVAVERLIIDNDLINHDHLVVGQAIVITYPEAMYTVKEGDTLDSIADSQSVSVMQLLRNNPFLSDRDYLYPGEELVVSYNTGRKVKTNGFVFPFISHDVLKKTLPSLTFLTIFNYTTTKEGEIITYGDDTILIEMAKNYHTIPLMMISTLAIQGVPNIEAAYEVLLNERKQDINIDLMINTIKTKDYYGANIVLYFITESNQHLYESFINKVSERFKREGYLLFLTINPNIEYMDNDIAFQKIDYSKISQRVDDLTFMSFIWGGNYGPPMPVSSNYSIEVFLNYIINMVDPERSNIGIPVIGYDWELPYRPGISKASSITINSAISLALDMGSEIQFDEISKTPFFEYSLYSFGMYEEHIVWFEDARTIDALIKLIVNYKLSGSGIWNIMIFFAQLWLIINSQFEVEKLLPENQEGLSINL